MKQVHSNALISSVTACVILAAQPVLAQTTQITEVQLNPADGGISVILKTSSGDKPQVFTTKRDKALVADIINTQLRLPQGKSFRQENPAPGIVSVEVNQLDANSVRVTVTGSDNAPTGKPVVRQNNGLTLGFTPSTDGTASVPITPNTEISSSATPSEPGKKIEVLVPNPEVSIDGQPAKAAGPNQPYNQAPPFLPRAVAPPVGDITQSNTDTSPTVIDLGTQERVPRLVLRDAPVREVLSLLARAAGLNLAFVGSEGAGAPSAGGQPGATANSQSISLDIENEPVQDVFNYVLRLSGLEANRSGRTIFVGTKLPNSTRDIVMRSLRLNQVNVGVALNFLVSMGAESAVSRERQVTSVNAVPVGTGVAPITQTQTTTETKVETQRINYTDSTPLLRGLQALGDERTNAVTLIGSPKLVEMATTQLTQLDIRRRQVVVNVKIVDVNLSGDQLYNTSFAFGIGNNYFSVDGGAASLNFGGSRPPTSTEARSIVNDTPTTANPLGSANIFLDRRDPSTGSPTAGVSTNPGVAGITEITPGTPDTPTEITYELPTLYQFPKRLLASLQAQVTSGNAKILTDPTLIVQEGSTANVKLTQEVIGNITNEITRGDGATTQTIEAKKEEVGLTLAVKVDRIDDNGFVSLSVAPVVKAPQAPANINVGTGSQTIFLVSERSLNSGTIRLRDGQTLILSGIIQDQDRTSISKVPILGDIPLIGSLFRRTNRTNERREVIVLLTPQVMDDSERSSYGYNYTPSPQVRQVLERRGLQVPGRQ
ncbi:AMIN domain-containing protein [Anabaena sp. WFMT]|uniref:AMIN domain-containing protein n=1 Tax=Anabaena sp. WFMT TaxID=3449730 RepID=UPI003F26604A